MRLNFNAETTTNDQEQLKIVVKLSDIWGKEHHVQSKSALRYIYSNTGLTTLSEWLSAKGIPSTFKVINDDMDSQVATILDIEENPNFTKLLLAA